MDQNELDKRPEESSAEMPEKKNLSPEFRRPRRAVRTLDANDEKKAVPEAVTNEPILTVSEEEYLAEPSAPAPAPEVEEEAATEEKPKEALPSSLAVFDWIKTFLFSLTLVIFIFTLLFRGVTVSGGSMQNTLQDKEYLVISHLFYTPKTGDIVVLQSPTFKNGTEPLIKRVIASGGQTVRINFATWQVWVDGVELSEPYVLKESGYMNTEDVVTGSDGTAEFVVDEGCVFVMGDHRNDSLDSRSNIVGQIHEQYIMGRVLLRISPLDRFGAVS